jgi:hypothetical protein
LSGYTFIAVPSDLVTRVIEFVEGQAAPRFAGPKTTRPVDDLLGWTQPLLQRAYLESGQPMVDLLDFLAEHPDEEVTSDEIATKLNAAHGWNTVAGMLGAFSRRCTGRYGRPGFPWEHRLDENGKGRMKMPKAIADVFTSAGT